MSDLFFSSCRWYVYKGRRSPFLPLTLQPANFDDIDLVYFLVFAPANISCSSRLRRVHRTTFPRILYEKGHENIAEGITGFCLVPLPLQTTFRYVGVGILETPTILLPTLVHGQPEHARPLRTS